ncbi:DUF5134 domain-containing protein [Streptomyces daliensis]|uniref:DUF5134 domain-containing protein n=1 Tax=Streptomyces daliensis TaxID=299421 RepID=A0A8T4IJY2_9ACTN|nr:DUF5134 domain-containing protein [Streptomyces daliensis]
MHGPVTVGWLLVALCAATGVSFLLRTRGAPPARRGAAGSEALMGFGMAAMALPGAAAVPLPPVVFVVLFGAAAAWELVLALEARGARHGAAHHLHHAVGCLAMVYMALAMTMTQTPHGSTGHHGGMAASAGLPLLTGALLAYFGVYVLRAGARLMPPGVTADGLALGSPGTGHAPRTRPVRDQPVRDQPVRETAVRETAVRDLPGLALACRLAMGTGMFAMLLTL